MLLIILVIQFCSNSVVSKLILLTGSNLALVGRANLDDMYTKIQTDHNWKIISFTHRGEIQSMKAFFPIVLQTFTIFLFTL